MCNQFDSGLCQEGRENCLARAGELHHREAQGQDRSKSPNRPDHKYSGKDRPQVLAGKGTRRSRSLGRIRREFLEISFFQAESRLCGRLFWGAREQSGGGILWRLRPDRTVWREAGPSAIPFLALSADHLGGNLGGSLSPSPVVDIGGENGPHPEPGAFTVSTILGISVQGGQGHHGNGPGDLDPPFCIGFQCFLGSKCSPLDEDGQELTLALQGIVTTHANRNTVKLTQMELPKEKPSQILIRPGKRWKNISGFGSGQSDVSRHQ